jgi:hypothetical protein
MTKKKCTGNCGGSCNCNNVDTKNADTTAEATFNYGFYSKVLNKPFDTLSELMAAEDVYFAEQKAKADKAYQKKTDAQKVEDTFKALNAARKAYKEDMAQLTGEYSEELTNLKKAFELGKKDIRDKLASAEAEHEAAIKEFNDKYPEGYHMTLKDGDFETTIDRRTSGSSEAVENFIKILFGI